MNSEIQFQIECLTAELVEMLMEEYGWDIKRSFGELYNSQFYEKLNDPQCGLYYEGSVYLFQFLKNEIENGRIQ